MIRLLCIAPYRFLPAKTGGQKAIFLLYKYLAKNTALHVASTKDNEQATLPFELHKVFSSSPLRYISLRNYFTLKKIVRAGSITHVAIEHPYMGIYGLMLKKSCQVKFMVRSHNIEAIRFKSLRKWWWQMLFYYEKYIHQKADHSFFITPEDRAYAIKHFCLLQEKTSVLTYGTELNAPLLQEHKKALVNAQKKKYNLPETATLLFFNGSFDYKPNMEALILLINKIMPALLQKDKNYHLIVCGKNIPAYVSRTTHDHITVAGFVKDVEALFMGSEIFVNPVWLGGGIKTKLVEALATGCAAVSFRNGAIGIPQHIVGNKLVVVDDLHVDAFVNAISEQKKNIAVATPASFYAVYSWEHIAVHFVDAVKHL